MPIAVINKPLLIFKKDSMEKKNMQCNKEYLKYLAGSYAWYFMNIHTYYGELFHFTDYYSF